MNRGQAAALCGVIAGCALAACGGSDRSVNETRRDTTTAAATANSPDTLTRSEARNAGVKPLDTASAAMESGPKLTINFTGATGRFLADRAGRPLYMYTADRSGQSACDSACAERWPPMIALQNAPSVGSEGVQGSLIGTVRRRDGSMQVTYNRHPLYYYQNDVGAGPPQGNDVKDAGGEWYLVTPEGGKAEDRDEDRS